MSGLSLRHRFFRDISKVFYLLFCLTCSNCLNSQELLNDALLWRVSGNNLPQDSYLFGTKHNTPYSFLDSIPVIRSLIQEVDCLVLEADLNDTQARYNAEGIWKQTCFLLPEEMSYSNVYSPEDYYLVDDLLFKNHLGKLGKMRLAPIPLIFYLMMIEDGGVEQDDYIEIYLNNTANNLGKKIVYLESIDSQNELLTQYFSSTSLSELICKTTIEEQAELLLQYVRGKDKGESSYNLFSSLTEKYMSQHLSELNLDSDAYRLLVTKRNNQWLPELINLFKSQKTFVAVGALHLTGNSGLIHQLKEKGYEVTPIR